MGYIHDLTAKKTGSFIGGILSKNSPEQMLKRDIENTATQVKFEGYLSELGLAPPSVSICKTTELGKGAPKLYPMGHFAYAIEHLNDRLDAFIEATDGNGAGILVEVYLGAETGQIVRIKC